MTETTDSGALLLGVNIDHVATLRQVRGTAYPDTVEAAAIAERAGADSITVHLREDRRHIQDLDVRRLAKSLMTRMNLEMALTTEMLQIAVDIGPADCCLVPERREELTTEGGLDVLVGYDRVASACATLAAADIRVSLFIDPDREQLDAASRAGAAVVELHTGTYADAANTDIAETELLRLRDAAQYGEEIGLRVHAGHGLNVDNVQPVAAIEQIRELNIGHAIISRALFCGLEHAVAEIKSLMSLARHA